MNKRNKVKHLNLKKSHREALIRNMALSLFKYERIESTKARLKVLQSYVDKLITRAKKNLTDIDEASKLHNKREVMKKIKNRDIVVKIFDDIAVRNKDRNGGYTRVYNLVNRISDNSEVALLELVNRKEREELIQEIEEKNRERRRQKLESQSKDRK